MSVSSQGRAVLSALASTQELSLTPSELREHVRRPGVSPNVARASLSRTLRRLWAGGLVELHALYRTFTELRDRDASLAAAVERDPAGEYQKLVEFTTRLAALTGGEARVVCNSPEAFRREAEKRVRRPPRGRIRAVRLTEAGRAAADRLTACPDCALTAPTSEGDRKTSSTVDAGGIEEAASGCA